MAIIKSTIKTCTERDNYSKLIADAKKVFNDYFKRSGAFKESGKKDEFPDAFAIDSIVKYCASRELIVVSDDKDWENCLFGSPNIQLLKTKYDVIINLCREEVATNLVQDYISTKINLLEIIEKEFFKQLPQLK